jgi:hypothetical protein
MFLFMNLLYTDIYTLYIIYIFETLSMVFIGSRLCFQFLLAAPKICCLLVDPFFWSVLPTSFFWLAWFCGNDLTGEVSRSEKPWSCEENVSFVRMGN